MTVVIQRVLSCNIKIDGACVSEIGAGLLLLVGIKSGDTTADADKMAEKIAKLRIFEDENGKMNRSVTDVGGELAIVSNFTLLASYKKGNRPDYFNAAPPAEAKPLYEYFSDKLEAITALKTGRGVFGADMKIALCNDGPVTIVMESEKL